MPQPAPKYSAERLRIHSLEGDDSTGGGFAEDVRRGLLSEPKRLQPKYFYDALGSQLFDAICLLPEYYLTRAENEIFENFAGEIVAAHGAPSVILLELGSGSANKTRRIIEATLRRQESLLYIPIDISVSALQTSARLLLQSYPTLRVEAYASDYDRALARLSVERRTPRERVLAIFLGSNIGNFDPAEARAFLRSLRRVLRRGDALLLGADLKKDAATLEAAYDDALGVTAAFNLNLLARINRELGADFRPRDFRHRAVYDEAAGRVEIYLESARDQEVRVNLLGLTVRFAAGERIHTENSYKYDIEGISRLASQAGFSRTRTWTDEAGRFSSNLLIAVDDVRAQAS